MSGNPAEAERPFYVFFENYAQDEGGWTDLFAVNTDAAIISAQPLLMELGDGWQITDIQDSAAVPYSKARGQEPVRASYEVLHP